MALQRTKLLDIQSVSGISTVGILTVGVTQTAGGVGITSTTYLRGVVMHNTGLATCVSSLYIYPNGVSAPATNSNYRLLRINLASNETFFFEANYPIVLSDRDQIVVSVTPPLDGGTGIGSVVNYQVLGDIDIT